MTVSEIISSYDYSGLCAIKVYCYRSPDVISYEHMPIDNHEC